jgi:hypothetical protein
MLRLLRVLPGGMGGPGIPRLRVACDLEEASGNSIGGGLCVAGGLPRLTWRSCFESGDSVSSFRHHVFVIGRPPSWVLKKHEKSAGIKYLLGALPLTAGVLGLQCQELILLN